MTHPLKIWQTPDPILSTGVGHVKISHLLAGFRKKYFPIPFLHLKKAKLFYFSFRFIGVSQINNKKQEQFGFRYFPIIFFGKNNLFPWKLNRNRLPAIFYLSFFSHRAQWLWRMSIAPYYISSLSQTGPVLTTWTHSQLVTCNKDSPRIKKGQLIRWTLMGRYSVTSSHFTSAELWWCYLCQSETRPSWKHLLYTDISQTAH